MSHINLRSNQALSVPFILAILVLAGCASTPQSRIEKNTTLFARLEPQDQMKIQNGDIDLGYTPEMVLLAKGEPKERSEKHSQGRVIIVWTYSAATLAEPPVGHQAGGLASPYGYPEFGPHPQAPAPLFYSGRVFLVEFERGKVVRFGKH